jgi:hypothetical protein
MEEFPGNSQLNKPKAKSKGKDTKTVQKIVKGDVIQRKKSLGRRFRELFMGSDIKGASSYIVSDVLYPALRNMVVDATTKGVERVVYGDSRPRNRPNHGSRQRTPYNRPVNRGMRHEHMMPDQPPRQAVRPMSDDIIISTLEDAQMVLDGLCDLIEDYSAASMADFKELVGMPSAFVDHSWGWTNLSNATVSQVRDGYLLDLPNPEPIQS